MWPTTRHVFDERLPLPRFRRIRQALPGPVVPDVAQAVAEALASLTGLADHCHNRRIALTAGSRGLAALPEILAAAVRQLRQYGAEPFIVPAMGSHGGATAAGQVDVLARLGVTPSTVGAPIEASMEVVEVGRLSNGMPVYQDRLAAEADGILLVNRVKPHTDFSGALESGLAKMAVIGLGKHQGAAQVHRYGVEGLQVWLPEAARLVMARTRVVGGLATVENARHQVARVAALPPAGIGGPAEEALLREAYALMARLPFDAIDVLVVDEMGKDISGVGLDPNVIGRVKVHGVPDRAGCDIRAIAVLSLTPATHGNATGVGLADVTTRRLVAEMDFEATYINCLTAGQCSIQRAAVPMVAPDDRAAIETAVRVCGQPDPLQARLVRIQNTLALAELDISESLWPLAQARGCETISPPFALPFTPTGQLLPFSESSPARPLSRET